MGKKTEVDRIGFDEFDDEDYDEDEDEEEEPRPVKKKIKRPTEKDLPPMPKPDRDSATKDPTSLSAVEYLDLIQGHLQRSEHLILEFRQKFRT